MGGCLHLPLVLSKRHSLPCTRSPADPKRKTGDSSIPTRAVEAPLQAQEKNKRRYVIA
uniref:Uncharacterized protein n=1 Tax=Utricularia reniformis TaxID=192314 RepID=A0A1Y0B2T1_9LAMI|nr:hypothetical protein AEK19_MT1569 [Utricularia reniformis]ART31755.1 hypothetical protein AEK19_MT1569 [Utricularia reniformis]